MDSAADHTVNEASVKTEERGYGSIAAGAIALVFLGFVIHAATLAPQDAAGTPAASAATIATVSHLPRLGGGRGSTAPYTPLTWPPPWAEGCRRARTRCPR